MNGREPLGAGANPGPVEPVPAQQSVESPETRLITKALKSGDGQMLIDLRAIIDRNKQVADERSAAQVGALCETCGKVRAFDAHSTIVVPYDGFHHFFTPRQTVAPSQTVEEARDRTVDDWFNMAPPDVKWEYIQQRVDALITAVRGDERASLMEWARANEGRAEAWPLQARFEMERAERTEAELERRVPDAALVEALRAMLDLYERHDRWCGYHIGSPGDDIIHTATEKAHAALNHRNITQGESS